MAYTEITIDSYNASPPTDDGSSDTINRVTWAGIKTKLGDPLNTAIASMNSGITSALGSIDTAITAADAALSSLQSADLSAAQANLYAPSGTEMFFVQTAAPTLWTKSTTHDNKALRMVSGTVSTGGSTAFTSVFTSRTITTAEMPSHTHTIASSGSLTFGRDEFLSSVSFDTNDGFSSGNQTDGNTSSSSGTGAFSATISFDGTTTSSGSSSAMDFAVQYVDVILAVKD
jgi:hypothetical protein